MKPTAIAMKSRHRLGAVLIVKNEAPRIEVCLRSAIEAGVTVATIVDTGSTDGTPEIIERVCAGIELHLHHRPFVDFGTNRSEAFALARGTADWLLALDADMTVEVDGWEPSPFVDAYLLDMGPDGFSNRLPLLLKGDLSWVSIGAAHEYTVLSDGSLGRREPTDAVRITQHGEWTPEKGRWYASLLRAELERQPENSRTTFCLAKTLDEIGEFEEARELYQRRLVLGGPAEETYYAAYRAALLEPDWPIRQARLISAWEFRPSRLEALHALVKELNERGHHQVAWALSSVSVPPCEDTLFIHRWIWDYGMLLERQVAAWWIGAPEFALITDKLLSLDLPVHVRSVVERNASLRAA